MANVFALLALAILFLVGLEGRAQVVTIDQSFKGTTAPGWTLGGNGYTPILTANGGGDANGSGWLRLTSSAGNESTYASYNTAFNAANATIAVKFDFAAYNGSGADGITFFLADASKTFGVGAYGGSLGYAQKTAAGGGGADINGMNGGYVGIGVDEFGNYSNPTEGRVGGVGSVPNAIAVRGPGQGLNGYNYLGGTGNLGANSIAFPGSTTRPTGANARSIEMILTATNQLTVYMSSGGSAYVPLYSIDLSGYARPDQLIMGFTGSTGGSTDIHEIQNVSLSSVAANLWSNTGADSKWATATDWFGASVPLAGADILLDNTYVNTAQTIDVGSGQTRSIRSLQIDAPFSYTLNNGTIEFNNNGIFGPSGILVSQTHGSATQTINSNLVADNAIEIRNSSAGTLNLTGTFANNGNSVTVDGAGNTSMSGSISGGGSLVKNDAGTLTLSGANTYSGGTTLSTGTLMANNNSALGTGALTINSGTLASTNSSAVGNAIALQGNAGFSGITTGGTLTQTGGSYTLTMANATQSGAVNLSEGNTGRTLTAQVDSGASTFSGVIANGGSGAGGLTKTGNGTLVLSSANTYTGTTAINAGAVQLGASNALAAASGLNLGANGTLNLNGFSTQVGNLAAAGGATIDFGPQTGANTFVFGTYTAPTSGVLVVNNWQSGTDTLATSVAGQNVGTIYISGYGVASEAASTSSTLYGSDYLLTPSSGTGIVWNGSASALWNTGGNWVGGGKPLAAQIAVFDSTGAGRPAVTLDGANTIAGLKFDTSAPAYTISGANTLTLSGTLPYIQQKSASNETLSFTTLALGNNTVADITGAGNLTIGSVISGAGYNLIRDGAGTGKLVLNGNNTFSGGLFVNNGIVQAGNTGALGTGTTTVSAGAALELTGGISPTNAISVSGTGVGGAGAIHNVGGANTLSGVITETAATTIAVDTGTTLNLTNTATGLTGTNTDTTLAGTGTSIINVARIATGTGGVTVNGGTVNFNGTTNANTYTGTTMVNSGTLNLGKTAGTIAIAGDLTINGGAVNENASNQIAASSTLNLNGGTFALTGGSSNTVSNVNSASGSTISLSNGSALTINTAGNSVINGTVTGAGAFNTQGTGNVTLAVSNSYSGGSTLASVVTDLSTGALGSGAVAINNGGNLQVQNGISLSNTLTLNSLGTSANDGAIQNVSGTNVINGATTLAGNSRLQSDSGTLALNGTIGLGANTLNLGGSGNFTVSGAISGTGDLTKDGAGTVLMNLGNTYTGATTINAGVVNVRNATSLGTTAGGTTVASGAALQLQGFLTIGAEALILNGTGIANDGALRSISGNSSLSGAITLGSDSRINVDSGTLVLSGGISGSGMDLTVGGSGNTTISGVIGTTSGTLTKDGLSTLTLSAANTYTGATAVSAGTLTVGIANAIGGSSAVTVAGGATLNLNSLNDTVGSIAGAGNVTLGTGTLTAGGDNSSTTFSGALSGSTGSLTKSGNGTLTLSGTNTYTGATNINAGTVQLGASNVLANTTNVSIGGLGTLNLNGFSQKIGTLTAANGATLDFGPQAGANTFVFGTYSPPASGVFVVSNWQSGTDTLATTVAGQNVSTVYLTGYGIAQEAGARSDNIYGTGVNGAYLLTPTAPVWTVWSSNASTTWNSGGAGGNWSGAVVPNSATALAELGTGTANPDLGGNRMLNGLKFDATAQSYNITGATRTLTMDSGTAGGIAFIQQQSANSQQMSFQTLTLNKNTVVDMIGSGSLTIGAALTGAGNLIKENTGGKLILSGNSTAYTGNIFVNNGVLQITSNNALGTAAGTTTVGDGAALEINGGTVTSAEKIAFQGNGVGNGGAIRNVAGTNTLSGTMTLAAAGRINSDAGLLTISAGIGGAGQNLTVGGPGNTTISGVIGTTTGSLTKDGAGTLTLSNANTFTGATTVNGGILTISTDGNLGAVPGAVTANALTLNGGTLQTSANLTLNSYRGITLGASGGTLDVNSGTTLTYGGVIAGAGGLTKADIGNLILSGANTYTGATTVNAGTLTLGANQNMAGSLVLSGGTLALGGTTSTFGSLSVTANSIIDFGTTGQSILNILGSVSVASGAILTINNWTDSVDYFYAQFGDPGATIRSRIVFAGYTGADTRWSSFDNEITPVPEPSTYGAVLMALGFLAGLCRRRRGGAARPGGA